MIGGHESAAGPRTRRSLLFHQRQPLGGGVCESGRDHHDRPRRGERADHAAAHDLPLPAAEVHGQPRGPGRRGARKERACQGEDLEANWAIDSGTSAPPATSITWMCSAFGLSRVTMMGGFGLFFDPGGRPRGRRLPVTTAPSLASPSSISPLVGCSSSSSPSTFVMSSSSCWLLVLMPMTDGDGSGKPSRPSSHHLFPSFLFFFDLPTTTTTKAR
jgi:hypothetical protein